MAKQSYEIEWEDSDGEEHVFTLFANNASEAQEMAAKKLDGNGLIVHVELYP